MVDVHSGSPFGADGLIFQSALPKRLGWTTPFTEQPVESSQLALIVSPQEKEEFGLLLLAKYGWLNRFFGFLHRYEEMAVLEISPKFAGS